MFKAILIEKDGERATPRLAELDKTALPEGDVTVRISHSTLNYKDGLAITGKGPIVRSFPMVPGVDFAGVVEESSNSRFKAGRCRCAQRVWRRRKSLGRPFGICAPQRRLARSVA